MDSGNFARCGGEQVVLEIERGHDARYGEGDLSLIDALHSAPRRPFMKMWKEGDSWKECDCVNVEITRHSVALQFFMASIDDCKCRLLLSIK